MNIGLAGTRCSALTHMEVEWMDTKGLMPDVKV